MVECSLKATITKLVSEINPFYGRLTQVYNVNDTYQMDCDNRPDICPFGILAKISIEDESVDLRISRHYLNTDDDGWYYATFAKDNLIYRLDLLYRDGDIDLKSTSITTFYAEDYMAGDDIVKTKVYATDFDGIEPLYC